MHFSFLRAMVDIIFQNQSISHATIVLLQQKIQLCFFRAKMQRGIAQKKRHFTLAVARGCTKIDIKILNSCHDLSILFIIISLALLVAASVALALVVCNHIENPMQNLFMDQNWQPAFEFQNPKYP